MEPILSKKQAKLLDKVCEEKGLISSQKLIDNAGKSAAQYFVDKIENPFNQRVLIVAGKGNNGADGVAMHHYLIDYGIESKIFLFNELKLKVCSQS